jgi:U4/U6 small nuclear ribonucleoprotein PRP31
VVQGCQGVLWLEEQKNLLLAFLEKQMTFLAPNMTEIIGVAVTAKLVAATGGIQELSKIPSGNYQVIGA